MLPYTATDLVNAVIYDFPGEDRLPNRQPAHPHPGMAPVRRIATWLLRRDLAAPGA
jgi:hypothetical protein